ncbi:hypothetical protein [Dactylosporangium sp. NPDC000521]|uniref:hypothetical protein n=1 Tax=Dactylosporangium sp. NPDC000521 TaxID=3363975 RepID=UPI0036C906D5
MLDGLDDLDWASLEHAYGPAADVPGHVRALRSESADDRRRALSGLYGGICHQGTRYEASAPAVPFLLELLADPATPDRAAVARLVASIAVGHHEAWLPVGFPVADLRAAAEGGAELLRAAPPPAEDDEDEDFEGESRLDYWDGLDDAQRSVMAAFVELAAYDAVRAGLPVLRDLLTGGDAHGDAALRAAAAFTLGWFPEDEAASVAVLTAAVADPSRSVAATAIVALGLLGTVVPAALHDARPEIRWAAAVALARVRGAAAGEEAAAELLRWAGGATTARAGIPFLDGDLAGYAALSLPALASSDSASDPSPLASGEALDALLARLGTVTGVETLPVLGTALGLVFPDGPGTGAAGPRHRLVKALADAPAAWQIGGRRFADVSGLLRSYGLPGDPEGMNALLTG